MRRRTFVIGLACCAFSLGSTGLASAQSPVSCGGVFPALEDATIDSNLINDPLGDAEFLEAGGIALGERRILLRFDLSGSIPPGSTIDSVALELTDWDSGNISFDFSVLPVVGPWNEFNVTWRNRPQTGQAIATRTLQLPHFSSATIDVTDVITLWSNSGLATLDLELVSASPWNEIRLASSETGLAPLLHVACSAPSPQLVASAAADDAGQQQALDLLRAQSTRPVVLRLDRGAIASAGLGIPTPPAMAGNSLARAGWFLDQYRGFIRSAAPQSDLQLSRRSADGMHLFYRQRHNGIPVVPGEIAVHLSQDEVIGLSGHYAMRIDLDPTPRLDATLATTLARSAAGGDSLVVGTPVLTYLDLKTMNQGDGQVHLAWQINVPRGAAPGAYFIDALNGQILMTLPLARNAFDLTLNTGSGAGSWGGDSNVCWWPTSADVEWFTESGVVSGRTPDAQGFTAFANVTAVDSFWRNTFGRDGHYGDGKEAHYIHVVFPGGLNSSFDSLCNIFEFDEGMAVNDLVGHEFTHGVIEHTAGLYYENESGALNESYADLFGFMVDSGDFLIGESSSFGTMRNLMNPPAGCPSTPQNCSVFPVKNCNPDHIQASRSGDRCGKRPGGSGALDAGWVHVNSSINNKAGALIIAGGSHNGFSVTGMGPAKAAQLFNAVITKWLGQFSQLLDARDVTVTEALVNPLFTPGDVCDVRNAYASVGLGSGDTDCNGVDDILDTDADHDGAHDVGDNCLVVVNPGQEDRDQDGMGDACDPDQDNDAIPNGSDNCPLAVNPSQADWENDGIGDACDDSDFDFILDAYDNCRTAVNKDQRDSDGDRIGDACDPDSDNDGLPDSTDNCPGISNPGGRDTDGDGVGDVCDNCALMPGFTSDDFADPDHDGKGNLCDTDDDGDGVADLSDNCSDFYNPGQADFDFNGDGTGCDTFETRQLYEDVHFWEQGRFIKWELPDYPIEIPLPVCPTCPAAPLPNGYTSLFTIYSDVGVNLRLVDREGMTRANDPTFQSSHLIALRPAPYGRSRFEYTGLALAGGISPSLGTDLSRLVKPDQESYSLLVYPAPGTDITNYHILQMIVHQCADGDGDGAYGGDETCLALGPADCDDKDAAMFPGNPEVCDNKDNNCDAIIDGFGTQCGLGACAAIGYCDSGFDTCQPNPPGQEVCDGLDNNCDGMVDNGQPPAPSIDISVTSSQISWSTVPDAETWDIAYGSLNYLSLTQGDFSLSTSACLAHRHTATSIVNSLIPPPGEGFWFLVRGNNCAGAGSYDEAGGAQAQPRDPGMNASPYACQDCSHGLCSTGPALTPTCDACAGQVCSFDPYCCAIFWDYICVAEANGDCSLGCL